MNNIFIFLNVLILLSGNLFFTHDHNSHDHNSHNHESQNSSDNHQCIECLALDNNHFTLNENYISFIDDNYFSFVSDEIIDFISFIPCNTCPRAPPISYFF